jgi:hypothetical protein
MVFAVAWVHHFDGRRYGDDGNVGERVSLSVLKAIMGVRGDELVDRARRNLWQ